MFSLLLSLLTRFSFAQVVAAAAVTAGATVTIAGSADVVSTFERVAAAAATGEGGAATPTATPGADPALAVLTSPVQFDGEYVLKNVTYRLTEDSVNIGAIVFRIEAPAVQPSAITVQASTPSGAYYRCTHEPVKGDLLVTCETKSPVLPAAKANRLYVEVHGS